MPDGSGVTVLRQPRHPLAQRRVKPTLVEVEPEFLRDLERVVEQKRRTVSEPSGGEYGLRDPRSCTCRRSVAARSSGACPPYGTSRVQQSSMLPILRTMYDSSRAPWVGIHITRTSCWRA